MFFSQLIGRKDPTHASGNQTRGGGRGLHGSHTFAIPNPFKDRHPPLTGAKQKRGGRSRRRRRTHHAFLHRIGIINAFEKARSSARGAMSEGGLWIRTALCSPGAAKSNFPNPFPPHRPQRAKTREQRDPRRDFGGCISRPAVGSGSRRRGSSTFGGGNHQPSVRPSTPD